MLYCLVRSVMMFDPIFAGLPSAELMDIFGITADAVAFEGALLAVPRPDLAGGDIDRVMQGRASPAPTESVMFSVWMLGVMDGNEDRAVGALLAAP
jgi:hypothetical protein